MRNKFKSILIKLSLLLFISAFLFAPFEPALAQSLNTTPTIYSVKFINNRDFRRLADLGTDVKQLFIGNQNPEFQNSYSFSSKYSLLDLQNYLAGEFVYLEPEQQMASAGIVVNDPGFSADSQNIDKEWGLIKTGFDTAWEKTTGSKNNVVAVIDTGIDQTHQDLNAINFLPGFDFINNKAINPGTDSDDNGHGTLVTGVLGATPNNGIGIAGTNWQISIMPVKALDATGKGDADTLAEAIIWATDHGAQFINLSVGGIGFGHDTSLANAVSYAFNKNVLVVAAAGNDSQSTGSDLDLNPIFPICDDNNYNMVLGVAATDQSDLKPGFSNYGKNCVDVTAPGKRILSTINFDPLNHNPAPNAYAYASGTSLAVPFVVGQAALIKTLYPAATNIQIRDRIIATADNIDSLNLTQCGGLSCSGLLGAGRIDVPKSLAMAINSDFNEGELIKEQDTGAVYEVLGGQKRLVSPFVLNQEFPGQPETSLSSADLASLPEGSYITPNDGTLVKYANLPTVFVISKGQKIPVSYDVFKQRNFSFSSVHTLSLPELDSWTTGNFLPPTDGTVVKTKKTKTMYWTVGGVLHPITQAFYQYRGLGIFPTLTVADADIHGYATGDAYIR